jgi:phospholipase C
MFGLVATLCIGCSEDTSEETPSPPPGPEEWNRDVTPPGDAEAAEKRASCTYAAGTLPAETQGASFPSGKEIPIDHIIIVMMENRSFDHYFQMLPEFGQSDVDVADADFSNPDTDGNPVPIFHDTEYCFVDTRHSWDGTHQQIAGGNMTGFVTSNEGFHEFPQMQLEMLTGSRAMAYYDGADLPFYYWLANEFAIGDRYFSSLPGPTLPNRMYLYGATSYGAVHNSLPPEEDMIIDWLEARELDWKVYATDAPAMAIYVSKVQTLLAHKAPIEQFYEDAAAGNLPQVAFIDPDLSLSPDIYTRNDEHPPAVAQVGQLFTAKITDALLRSPNWPRSAMFFTYDEHGGTYDHVTPPEACIPDDYEPTLEPGDPDKPLDRYGVRVPFIVVSPFAKKHHVAHETYDHTSILRFVQARFVMPAFTARDANALAPWDMFDFDNPAHLEPPVVTLPLLPDQQLDICAALFPEGN